jgi:ubiquinone/menaquinone biosynthesis C-methylase UbiE
VDARQAEVEKYRSVYARYDSYAMADDRRGAVMRHLQGLSGSMLDVSCGRGELLTAAEAAGFGPVQGTEAVPELCDGKRVINAQIHALPFAAAAFDVVVCVDVLEHILEPDIEPGLQELERVTKGTLILAAADYPTYWDGINLHPSARPYADWHQMFCRVLSGKVTWAGQTPTSEVWRIEYAR